MRRVLALFLSLVMVFQMLPASVLAENGALEPTESNDVRGVVTHTVTWIVDGATGSYTAEDGTLLSEILPASPTKEGDWRFIGWVSDPEDPNADPVDTSMEITADISVTAVFEAVTYYDITFQAEGSEAQTVRAEAGTAIGSQLPEAPERDGYRLNGWFAGETPVTSETVFEQNTTVTASYTELIKLDFDPTTDPAEPQAHIQITLGKGDKIGELLPAVPEKPGYNGSWSADGATITADTVVENAFTAEPAYVQYSYTVTFIQEDGTKVTKQVSVDDSFAVNELPAVTPKTNQEGKWVYEGTNVEFPVGTTVTGDTTVVAAYEQSVFTVQYKMDGDYDSFTQYKGTKLILPTEPVKTGAQFKGWFTEPNGGGTEYTADSEVDSDLTLYAHFEGLVRVHFIVMDKSGSSIISEKSQYFVELTEGSKVGTLPEEPFEAGRAFVKWVDEAGNEVTADTIVTKSINAVAVFTEIGVYTVHAEYYYMDGNVKKEVGKQDYNYNISENQAEQGYTITAPESAPVTVGGKADVYYPSESSFTVYKNQFEKDAEGNLTYTKRIQYVPSNAEYTVKYWLKDATGDGDSIIEEVYKQGVKGTKITPEIKEYEYAIFKERDENVDITGDDTQEILNVYYTRKEYTLSYNVEGGIYIEAVTAPYGTKITLPTTATRTGYTFIGWKKAATDSNTIPEITLEKDTTLIASWKPDDVDYNIVYMIENADDDGYSFLASVTKKGETGASVTMNAQMAGANGTRPKDLDTNNFTYKKYESASETIEADGSTVIVVYYTRNVYTISWNGDVYNTDGDRRARNQGSNATLKVDTDRWKNVAARSNVAGTAAPPSEGRA